MTKGRILASFVLAMVLAFAGGCDTLSPGGGQTAAQQAAQGSPEAQIVLGARLVEATAGTITSLSRSGKFTPAQVEAYTATLKSANGQLHEAERGLTTCRRTSPQGASPDPCRLTVGDLITLAITNISNLKRVVEAK